MPRFARALFCLLALASSLSAGPRLATGNPLPPEPQPRLVTADSLLQALHTEGSICRGDAVHQLQSLSIANLSVLRAALRIPYEDVQRGAIRALARIGDETAIAILREAFQDTSLSKGIRIAAAEALGDARDVASIPMLEEAARRSSDVYLARFVRKAVRRMSEPDFDRPILSFEDGHLWYRFLREDVDSVFAGDHSGKVKRIFTPSEAQEIFRLLSKASGVQRSSIMNMESLQIALRNGRRALLWMSGDDFAFTDTSRYWHGSPFVVSSPVLMAYIRERTGEEPAGTAADRDTNDGLPAGY